MAYPAHFFTLVRLDETKGVVSANICEVYELMRYNTPRFPVAQHFNSIWPQYFSDVQVRGVALCNGNPGITILQGESKIISLNRDIVVKELTI